MVHKIHPTNLVRPAKKIPILFRSELLILCIYMSELQLPPRIVKQGYQNSCSSLETFYVFDLFFALFNVLNDAVIVMLSEPLLAEILIPESL